MLGWGLQEKRGRWPRYKSPDHSQSTLILLLSAGPHTLTQQEVCTYPNPSFLYCISSLSQKLPLLRHRHYSLLPHLCLSGHTLVSFYLVCSEIPYITTPSISYPHHFCTHGSPRGTAKDLHELLSSASLLSPPRWQLTLCWPPSSIPPHLHLALSA